MNWAFRIGQVVVAVVLATILVECIQLDSKWGDYGAVWLLSMFAILPHWPDPRNPAKP